MKKDTQKTISHEIRDEIAKTITSNMDRDIRDSFISNKSSIRDMIFFTVLNMSELAAKVEGDRYHSMITVDDIMLRIENRIKNNED